jgi:hypothetical protein
MVLRFINNREFGIHGVGSIVETMDFLFQYGLTAVIFYSLVIIDPVAISPMPREPSATRILHSVTQNAPLARYHAALNQLSAKSHLRSFEPPVGIRFYVERLSGTRVV